MKRLKHWGALVWAVALAAAVAIGANAPVNLTRAKGGGDTCTGASCAIGAAGVTTDGGFLFASAGAAIPPAQGQKVSIGTDGSGGEIWGSVGTPSATNYGLFMSNTATYLNGPNNVNMSVANGVSLFGCTSTLCTNSLPYSNTTASGSVAIQTLTGAKTCMTTGGTSCWSIVGGVLTWDATNNINLNQTVISTAGSGGFNATGTGGFSLASAKFISVAAPTVTSAGSSPSVTAANGSVTFRVNVGTGGTATTVVLAMPTASTGWNCWGSNLTAAAANRNPTGVLLEQSSTTTAATLQYQTVATGVALAFVASDILQISCLAY